MNPKDRYELGNDIADEFKAEKKSFLLFLFPFLRTILENVIIKFARRKGWID